MYQLAKRLNMDRSAVSKLEESEKRGTITINSLLKVAEALDCELHYILIPRQSLEKCVMEQARKVEQRRREQIATTMTLEEQPTTPSSPIQESLEAALLVINDDKSLWDED
jgi:predicted DNA-binding mobile mystery protein A